MVMCIYILAFFNHFLHRYLPTYLLTGTKLVQTVPMLHNIMYYAAAKLSCKSQANKFYGTIIMSLSRKLKN